MSDVKNIGDSVLKRIPLDQIAVVEGRNIRQMTGGEWQEAIEEMAYSLAQTGQQQPIIVSHNKETGFYEIIAGHRRYNGAKLANEKHNASIEYMDAIVKKRAPKEAELLEVMLADAQSSKLKPLEVAEGIKRFQKISKLSQKEIADKLGFTQAYISQLATLADAPEELKQAVENGEISAANATELVRDEQKGKGNAVETFKTAQTEAKKKGKGKVTKGQLEKSKPQKKDYNQTEALDHMIYTARAMFYRVCKGELVMDKAAFSSLCDMVSYSEALETQGYSLKTMRELGDVVSTNKWVGAKALKEEYAATLEDMGLETFNECLAPHNDEAA